MSLDTAQPDRVAAMPSPYDPDAQRSGARKGAEDEGRCPACGNRVYTTVQFLDLDELHRKYTADEAHLQEMNAAAGVPGNAVQMVRCGKCSLEFCRPMLSAGAQWSDLVRSKVPVTSPRRWEFEFALRTISAGETVGEIGCGNGEFLRLCQQAGIRTAGIGPSPEAVEKCRHSVSDGSAVAWCPAWDSFVPPTRRSVIVAFDVLEHLDDPKSLFDLAHRWASPGGRLLLAVPSDRRPSRRIREDDWLDTPPHHLTRWTESALRSVCEGTGWECRKVSYEPIDASAVHWWLTTRSTAYQQLKARGWLGNPWMDRACRAALTPVVAAQFLQERREMSGHSMFAEYWWAARGILNSCGLP